MNNINRFGELNKNAKLQKKFNQVRTHEEMSELAKQAIANNEIDTNNKYYSYVQSFANGSTVTNKFGAKLYFKRG